MRLASVLPSFHSSALSRVGGCVDAQPRRWLVSYDDPKVPTRRVHHSVGAAKSAHRHEDGVVSTDMSHSLLHALRARASDMPAVSAGDATMTLRVGPELELLVVEKRLIPRRCSWSHKIPEQRNPEFVRLVLQFWQEGSRTTASAFTEFRVTFATFAESFAPGIEPPRDGFWDGHPGALPGRAHPAAELVPQLNAAHARHLDQTRALRRSRLQLILRGGCLDFTP